MPKSYPDVTRSGAASAEVQEEGRKPTTPASPGLAPQLSHNSNTNWVGLRLDLCFSSSSKERPLLRGKHSSLGEVSP
jgi:hypothetical protein